MVWVYIDQSEVRIFSILIGQNKLELFRSGFVWRSNRFIKIVGHDDSFIMNHHINNDVISRLMYHSIQASYFDCFWATLTLWGLVGLKYIHFPDRLVIHWSGDQWQDGNIREPPNDIGWRYKMKNEKMDFGGNGYNDRRLSEKYDFEIFDESTVHIWRLKLRCVSSLLTFIKKIVEFTVWAVL